MSFNGRALLMDSARVVAVTLKSPPGTLISEYLDQLGNPMLNLNDA
jgi:hypothetical protein